MKKQFMGPAFIVLVLIAAGGFILINAKPVYSDFSNLPIRIGGFYSVDFGNDARQIKILSMPDSSGWIKANALEPDNDDPKKYVESKDINFINLQNANVIYEISN
ncbi:MAG: hypothetical protein ACYDH3_06880 [Candidatus Aminicenantales bacterium]